jgi:hypothetical protein
MCALALPIDLFRRGIVARMNENPPICASAMPTVRATLRGYFMTQTITSATTGFAG